MGAFLAALGAVLLFILRVIGILLLVVLILLVLLLLCPFCADLCWEHGVLTVRPVRWHHFPDVPVPEAGAAARRKTRSRPGALARSRQSLPHGGPSASEKRQRKAAAAAHDKPAAAKRQDHAEILCTMLKGLL